MVLESAHEKTFHRLVRDRLGGIAIKVMPTVAGVPDRLVLLPGGRLILVELKTEKGQLRPIQVLFHAKAASLGIGVTTLHGLEEIKDWIRQQEEVLDA